MKGIEIEERKKGKNSNTHINQGWVGRMFVILFKCLRSPPLVFGIIIYSILQVIGLSAMSENKIDDPHCVYDPQVKGLIENIYQG